MAEYRTNAQVNYGFGLSFQASGKAPVIAKRIWKTLADAQAYVDSTTDTAIAGLQLTVVNDTDASKNGVYFVKEAAGENSKTKGVLVKLAAGGDTSSLQSQITANKTAIDTLNADEDTAGSVKNQVNAARAAANAYTDTQCEVLNEKMREAITSTYRVKGCIATLDALIASQEATTGKYVADVGDVWNIQNAFQLESKPYPAGTNVVWASAETAEDAPAAHKVAHWDALGGTVDLSGYFNNLTGSGSGNVISGLSAKDGTITFTRSNVGDLAITGYTKPSSSAAITATDKLNAALGKLEAGVTEAKAAASSAANSGVTSLGKMTGNIYLKTAETGDAAGTVQFTLGEDRTLRATVNGLDSAAYKKATDFATATQGNLASTAMQGAAGDSYVKAEAGGSQGKTVAVTANVAKMADVDTDTIALADAADVKKYIDDKAASAVSSALAWTEI